MSADEKDLTPEEGVTPVRRRVRISKSSKEDHVYQASSDGQGERFDTEEQKKAAKKAAPAIFAIDPASLVPPRKNRGRPSKAYLEALAEYERKVKMLEELKAGVADVAPSQTDSPAAADAAAPQAESVPAASPAEKQTAETPAVAAQRNLFSELPEEGEEKSEKAAPAPKEKSGESFVVNDKFIVLRDVPTVAEENRRLALAADQKAEPVPEAPSVAPQPAEEVVHEEQPAEPAAPLRNDPPSTVVRGVVELERDNSGYLRSSDYNYLPSPDDVLVSVQIVRQYGLKTGDVVECEARMPRGSEHSFVCVNVLKVNGLLPRKMRDRVAFENLTPLFPDEKFTLCSGEKDSMSCRIVDLFSPIGKGQRALIVAQPKTGKTLLMKDVANAIARNHPDTHLIMLLIDERPEEVTDMARTVNAEVIASTFDEPASQHVRIAAIVLEKAKRLVECGHDVVIFLDSITRLARAYNTVAPTSGKILSGGVEANALQKPKRFFGAARNIEGGGSLTIVATALIETGSKMDEVIFEEFKGTGNMELQLERALANKRIFPAVNLIASSTRRDELLYDELTRQRMPGLRSYLSNMNTIEAMQFLRQRLDVTRDNKEFLVSINS